MKNLSQTLFIIPARGGSKGIPGKNIKPLGGKPLIHYSLEFARHFIADEHICLSTDSIDIVKCANQIGYSAKFIRPALLATDKASTYDVLIHAINEYDPARVKYQKIILLQPTSPFREYYHLEKALELYTDDIDMVTSVFIPQANPYYSLFEENIYGFLEISKGQGLYTSRQQVPKVYQLNGSIYIINTKSLYACSSINHFKRIKKFEMEEEYSIDLDTPYDWKLAEFTLNNQNE